MQWLTRKCTTNESKYVERRSPFGIQLIVFTFCMKSVYRLYTNVSKYTNVYRLYTNCTHNVYDVHFLQNRIDVHKMNTKCIYTKCTQNVCIQNVPHISANFCIQNVLRLKD